ncbi:Do family serine endopeptidase [Enterovirga rhinocerotis]|uniref:Probable periplasmic serine endoprotease DegP-like n=1 Tax=Enterovirga rhinocerotis TaxID=1339210 RepID=A0A4R7C928_9HYPH|nr:Do family serine endopeptidase [Enterovirga rhinocerotis]TDR94793.1 serine protease Do [Enterovirga rhinocerotis]
MSSTGQSGSSSLRRKALASAAAVAIVASGAVGAAVLEGHPAFAQAPITVSPQSQSQAPASFADVVDAVKPAVVSVKVMIETASDEGGMGSRMERLPPQLRELFGDRFSDRSEGGPRRQAPRRGQSQGSGFFISADGFVVTNNHVVQKASQVEVTTDDGRTLKAKVIGSDPKSDLALLKVEEAGTYPFVKLAPAQPRVGDWVVAIGNPFGLGGTVTSGIVSARGRDIGAGPYDDFLQIDASINRGNSGGPTFNLRGEVVGVNTAIASPSGGSVGLAFAIPAATVESVVAQLKDHGSVSRGFLGVQIQPMTKDLAEGLGIDRTKGALINSTEPGTPAAKAGLRSGDVLVSVNGQSVADARDLSRRIAGLKPGSKVDVVYLRDGRERTTEVQLGELPEQRSASLGDRGGVERGSLRLGLQLAPAPRGEDGVAVMNVDPDGPAAGRGIREGDIIVEVGGKTVRDPSDVADGIKAARADGRKAVLMRVKSRDGTRFVAIALSPNAG